MSRPENRNPNDDYLVIRTSLQQFMAAKNAIVEETRSLKVRIRTNIKKVDSLKTEKDRAQKRLDTLMERVKVIRRNLLERITSRAEIPELRLHHQKLLRILQDKQMEKVRILDEIRQKQASAEQKMETLFKQRMHENRILLEKVNKEISDLEAEFRELSEQRSLHAQEQVFAEELKSLEAEMESEVNKARTADHSSCQKKRRQLMKQKQELEERVRYLTKKLDFSVNK